MEQVKLTTYDGVELVANLYLPSKVEGGGEWSSGIIVCHGFASNKENYAHFGEMAGENGYAALILDLRGHGESGGEVDANIFNDVAAALQYLQSRPEVNPTSIAIQGSSLGGWLAVHTAAHLKDVSPVVAYAPPNEAMLTILMEEVALVQRGHSSPMVPENPPKVNVNSMIQLLYRLDITKSARRIYPRPLLLIHCEGDEEIPSIFSERIYSAIEEPKTLWLIPGGNHRFAQHDPETNKRVLDWLAMSRPETEKLSLDTLPDD
ncbi:MAG: alpha/beta hydrolase [Chloroflexia bacterium]